MIKGTTPYTYSQHNGIINTMIIINNNTIIIVAPQKCMLHPTLARTCYGNSRVAISYGRRLCPQRRQAVQVHRQALCIRDEGVQVLQIVKQ